MTKSKSIMIGIMTHPKRQSLEQLLRQAIQKGLIACGNILPSQVVSIYTWKGKIHRDKEVLLIFKTTPKKVSACVHFLKQHHPYSCPEILLWKVNHGSSDYLKWVHHVCAS